MRRSPRLRRDEAPQPFLGVGGTKVFRDDIYDELRIFFKGRSSGLINATASTISRSGNPSASRHMARLLDSPRYPPFIEV